MGNLCLNVVAKYLTEKYGYTLKYYAPTEYNYEQLLKADYSFKNIIQFGDLYLFSLTTDTLDCIIEPFIRQICKDVFAGTEILDPTRDDKLFVIGFSQLNWCKIIATAMLSKRTNPFLNRDFNNELHLKFLCAAQANTKQAEKQLAQVLHGLTQKEYDANREQELCNSIHMKALNRTKLGLGQMLLLFIFKMLSKQRRWTYLTLDCDPTLYGYYASMGFRMGPSPLFKYSKPFSKWKPAPKGYAESKDINEWNAYYYQEYENFKRRVKPENGMISDVFVHTVNLAAGNINMFMSFDHRDIPEILEKIEKYKPNVFHILNNQELQRQAFNIDDDVKKLLRLVEQTECLNTYIDSVDPGKK
jgi:hypothetical protein